MIKENETCTIELHLVIKNIEIIKFAGKLDSFRNYCIKESNPDANKSQQ